MVSCIVLVFLSSDLTVFVALRVEYLKARARATRWEEHKYMLLEEQRRVSMSLENTAVQWDARRIEALVVDDPYRQGLAAYAAEQAAIQRRLKAKYERLWASMPPPPTVATEDATNVIALDSAADIDNSDDEQIHDNQFDDE